MQKEPRSPTLTLHMVMSLDGFIAQHDNDVSWLETTDNSYPDGVSLSQDTIDEVLGSIDCYLMGSRTYDHALELGWPYGDTPVVVLTSRKLEATRSSVEFFDGDLDAVFTERLTEFGSVWLVGGASLCQRCLEREMVDRLILTIAPVTLGDGLRLFDGSMPHHRWRLVDTMAFRSGMVELTYEIERDPSA